MAAEISLTQFRKVLGQPGISPVTVDTADLDLSMAFTGFGDAGFGYSAPPTTTIARRFPVKAGTTSWEIWFAPLIAGSDFQIVTDLRLSLLNFDWTGLGNNPNVVGWRLANDNNVVDRTGLYMRVEAGPIEMGSSPQELSRVMPLSSPRYGLPPSDDGWLLFNTLGVEFITPDEATDTSPPNCLNLTPVNTFLNSSTDVNLSRGITPVDLEPRYGNIAVVNLVLASNATSDLYDNFMTLGLSWSES